MMNIEEYRQSLHEDIVRNSESNLENPNFSFLMYVTDLLTDGEEIDDFIECYWTGISSRYKAKLQIDGYALDEVDGSCCLFISDFHGPQETNSINKEDIDKLFNCLRNFVIESVQYDLYEQLEPSSQVYELSKYLHDNFENISKFRFYIVTDAFNRQKVKNLQDEDLKGKGISLNVWDINRIFDLVNSKSQKESIDIILSDIGCSGIPCVKAVEYHNIKADIDVIKNPAESGEFFEEDAQPDDVITYSSYLAVVPGQVLNDLYLEYGSRLLEGNVRSFLSSRGKINKGIQNTIKNYPEMFFAYNNGISATATELDVEDTASGPVIKRIKDLQIVNGGQTTASITNTILNVRAGETVRINQLFVPMKISVLEHRMSEKIIPKISKCSNTQNKVDESDFFSNHPFHIRMEDYSRKTPAPAVNGNQYQQYWYYERARGQYNQGKMMYKPKSREMKQYETKYPANQVIKMVELCKYMEIYMAQPHVVSKGKQAIVKDFASHVTNEWNRSEHSNEKFNKFYFQRVVALAIIFKETDSIIKETDWYKEKHSYKANVIAYTMSIIFNYIRESKPKYELDFMRIWNEQTIFSELREQIEILCTQVYEFITGDRGTENVTEWCKREACWMKAQSQQWEITPAFLDTLILQEEQKVHEKEAKEERQVNNEVDLYSAILQRGMPYWEQVYQWGAARNLLSSQEMTYLKYAITGRLPNNIRVLKSIVQIRERLIEDGMPLQF
ncbi:MAG: AIPR family protein [Elusimicrobia bacterium]|nr:AIPR family protein [Elusimicrobiota bacterium]